MPASHLPSSGDASNLSGPALDLPPAWQERLSAIHNSGRQMVVAVTGGGSGALAALLHTPGASRTILEAIVPYSLAALADWIGGRPDQACSPPTAQAMAMAAFMRAQRLAPQADRQQLLGIGCTASLATDRPKRGARRLHVAAQTAGATEVHSAVLRRTPALRALDEIFATVSLLELISRACGAPDSGADAHLDCHAVWQKRQARASEEQSQLLWGTRRLAILKPGSTQDYFDLDAAPPRLVFPGAFNPPHDGHFAMAAIAEQRLQQPATWEVSIVNVDKPPLDFLSMGDRIASLRARDSTRALALTRAATFVEKAELFPGATFIVGADTLFRIAEPRYYGGDATHRNSAIAQIAAGGCRFLVFGREVEGRFQTLEELAVPAALRSLCSGVSAEAFRNDISSSELRRGAT